MVALIFGLNGLVISKVKDTQYPALPTIVSLLAGKSTEEILKWKCVVK